MPVHQCLRSQAGLFHSHGSPVLQQGRMASSLAPGWLLTILTWQALPLAQRAPERTRASFSASWGCAPGIPTQWHTGGPKSLGFWSHLAFTWGKGWFIYRLRKPPFEPCSISFPGSHHKDHIPSGNKQTLSPEFPLFLSSKSPVATKLQLRGRIKGTGASGAVGPTQSFALFNSLLSVTCCFHGVLFLWVLRVSRKAY